MRKRLLYLEDDATTRTALAYILQHEGYEVFSYGAAEDALGHLSQGDIDIAVLDVRLPGRHGDDFGRELMEKWPKMRVIILTAEQDIDEIKRLVPHAMVVHKPADVEVLLELLRYEAPAAGAGSDEPPQSIPFPPQAG